MIGLKATCINIVGVSFQSNEQKYFLAPCTTPSVLRRDTWLSLYMLLWKYNLKCLHSYTSMEKTIFCSITIIIVKERAKNTIRLSENCHLNLKQLHIALKRFLSLKNAALHMLCLPCIRQIEMERLES